MQELQNLFVFCIITMRGRVHPVRTSIDNYVTKFYHKTNKNL